ARLREAARLRVSQGEARLWTIPDRSADQSEYRDIATDHAVESDGLAGDTRCELGRDPRREVRPLCNGALSAGGARTLAGAETRYRSLRRTCGDEGDTRRGPVGAVHGARRCAGGFN